MLELHQIHKAYQLKNSRVIALDSISLSFPESGIVAILGPSGCGKTTLMNIIGGMDREFEGDIKVRNESLAKMSETQVDTYRKRRIGFIFQHAAVINSLTVLENVTLAMALSGENKVTQQKRAMELLSTFDLRGVATRKINTLSGGQKQRVIIARALANDPDIILADEPTGELDTKNSDIILKLLRKLSHHRLILMVTHEEKFAVDYADRIIRMKDGQVVKDEINIPLPGEGLETQWTPLKKKLAQSRLRFIDAVRIAYRSLLVKKGRTFWTSFGTAVGLIGIGLALSITIGFSNIMKREIFSNFDVNSIAVAPIVSDDFTVRQNSPSQSQINAFVDQLSEENSLVFRHYEIDDYRMSSMTSSIEGGNTTFPTIDHLKHFYPIEWVDFEIPEVVYLPSKPISLMDNQVILGINPELDSIYELCEALDLGTCNFDAIGDYLSDHESFSIQIGYSSLERNVDFQTSLEVKAIALIPGYEYVNSPVALIHTNPNWNKELFEDQDMPISSSLNWSDSGQFLEKVYILFKEDRVNELNKIVQNEELMNYFFGNALITGQYGYNFPEVIQLIYNESPRMSLDLAQRIVDSHPESILGFAYCSDYILSCSNQTSFSYKFPFVVSTSEEKNLEVLNRQGDLENPSEDVLASYSIKYKPYDGSRLTLSKQLYPVQGQLAAKDQPNQIVISEGMAKVIQKNDPFSLIGKSIIGTFPSIDNLENPDEAQGFNSVSLTVTGILLGEEQIYVYQDSSWGYTFGTEVIGFEPYQMTSTSLSLSIYQPDLLRDIMEQLSLEFKDYSFSNFFIEIIDIFNQIITGVRWVLISLSSISVLVAILMVAIVTYLAVVERTREIGIIRAIGGRKADIRNMFLIESWVIGVFAAIISLTVVTLISQGINLAISGILSAANPDNAQYFTVAEVEWITISTIVGSAFALSILAGMAPAYQASKLDPIKALKKR